MYNMKPSTFFKKISAIEMGKEPIDNDLIKHCKEVLDYPVEQLDQSDRMYARLFFDQKFNWVWNEPKVWVDIYNELILLSK